MTRRAIHEICKNSHLVKITHYTVICYLYTYVHTQIPNTESDPEMDWISISSDADQYEENYEDTVDHVVISASNINYSADYEEDYVDAVDHVATSVSNISYSRTSASNISYSGTAC